MAGNRRSGRPRKPVEQHQIEGTYRADRHASATDTAGGLPDKPADLSADAAWLWDLVVTDLAARGIVKRIDTALLWSMCELWGLYRSAVAKALLDPIDKATRTAVTSYWTKFEIAASRFGLNASDRARLQVAEAPKQGVMAWNRDE